jgi:hypothetical protein
LESQKSPSFSESTPKFDGNLETEREAVRRQVLAAFGAPSLTQKFSSDIVNPAMQMVTWFYRGNMCVEDSIGCTVAFTGDVVDLYKNWKPIYTEELRTNAAIAQDTVKNLSETDKTKLREACKRGDGKSCFEMGKVKEDEEDKVASKPYLSAVRSRSHLTRHHFTAVYSIGCLASIIDCVDMRGVMIQEWDVNAYSKEERNLGHSPIPLFQKV